MPSSSGLTIMCCFPSTRMSISCQHAPQTSVPHSSLHLFIHVFTRWLENTGLELTQLQTLWRLQEHGNVLALQAEMTCKALSNCHFLSAPGPTTQASLLFSNTPGRLLPLGLCTCYFCPLAEPSSTSGSCSKLRSETP